MSKNFKRLMFAAGLSATSFASTFYWYHQSTPEENFYNTTAVARLLDQENEVHKKAVSKILWQPLADNEILYDGESIRTGDKSLASIEFLETNTKIELEPNSAIVLEKNPGGELTLNFISGNLYVKSTANTSSQPSRLKFKSGTKEIDLQQGEINLSRSENKDLDIEILRGQASVDGQSLSAQTQLQLLSPLSGSSIYLEEKQNSFTLFKWKPIDKNYQVFVEAGTRRSQLTPLDGLGQGDAGKLQLKLEPGRLYYRLVAKDPGGRLPLLKSPVHKNTVVSLKPPVLLAPQKDETLSVNIKWPTLHFAWQNPLAYKKTLLQISQDPTFAKPIYQKEVSGKNEHSLDIKTAGLYHWRLVAEVDGLETKIVSAFHPFKLEVAKTLLPPKARVPLNQQAFVFEEIQEQGLGFQWEPLAGVVGYTLQIWAPENKSFETRVIKTKLAQIKVKGLPPGRYAYHLQSVGRERGPAGQMQRVDSPFGKPLTFSIKNLPKLNWVDGRSEEDHYFISLKPSVDLKWQSGPKTTQMYEVRHWRSDREAAKSQAQIRTPEPHSSLPLPEEGTYIFQVTALDSAKRAIARSVERRVHVRPAPLLPAPVFSQSTPEQLKADGSGLAQLSWEEVNGAKAYVLTLKNPNDELVKRYQFTKDQGHLKGLLPGEYKLSLKSLDQHGREGPEGEERVLRVPATSDLRAPKLKGFKVK